MNDETNANMIRCLDNGHKIRIVGSDDLGTCRCMDCNIQYKIYEVFNWYLEKLAKTHTS